MLDVLARYAPRNVLLIFGHVDIHINWLWQLKVRGSEALSPSDWVQRVASDYMRFLDANLIPLLDTSDGPSTLFISSVTYPVVDDQHLEACITKYTEAYNSYLQDWCNRHHNVKFVDLNPYITSRFAEKVSSILKVSLYII
ncbi:hypothetical protein RQP46_004784 [Phenoliferia psychrophenolica]